MSRTKAPLVVVPAAVLQPPVVSGLDAAVLKVVAYVKKDLDDDSVLVRLDGPGAYPEIKHVVSTGLSTLDAVFGGCGGLPLGKLVVLGGPESVGKTTLTKFFAARCQLVDVMPATFDTEQSGVLDYDTGLGVDPTRAAGGQPTTMERVFEAIMSTVDGMEAAGTLGMVFWDSVAATPLQAELDLGVDEYGIPGERARYLSKHLPQMVAKLRSGRVGLVFVNQVREKIGAGPFEKKTFSPGGRALRHYAHVFLELTSFGQIKSGETVVGIKTRVKATKNKLGMPYREAVVEIRFDPPRVIAAGAEKKPARIPYNRGR